VNIKGTNYTKVKKADATTTIIIEKNILIIRTAIVCEFKKEARASFFMLLLFRNEFSWIIYYFNMKYILIWICTIITHASCSQVHIKNFDYNSSLWKSAAQVETIKADNKAFRFKCSKISHPLIQSPSMVQGSKAVFNLIDKKQILPANIENTITITFDKFNSTFKKNATYLVYFSNEGTLLYIEEF
jgi:hypothetical protein